MIFIDYLNCLPELRIFFFVAKNSSMTLAANELCLTQPAISHSIKQFEAKLGFQLFIRDSRHLTLSPEGSLLYESSKKIFQELKSVQKSIDSLRGLGKGVLAFSAPQMLVKYFLMSHLQTFHAVYPQITFKIESSSKRETLKLVSSGQFEFGILTTPFELEGKFSNLEFRKICQINDVLISKSNSPLVAKKKLKFSDLAKLPLIALRKNLITREHQEQFFKQNGIEIEPSIECDTFDLAVEFVEAGFGIGWVTDNVLNLARQNNREISKLDVEKPLPSRHICFIKRKESSLSSAAEVFLNHILNSLKNKPTIDRIS